MNLTLIRLSRQFRVSHCLPLLAAWACVSAPLSSAQELSYNTAQFLCQDVSIVVVVNGFPLYQLPAEGNQATQSSLLGQFLKRGANEVVIRSTRMAKEGGALAASHATVFELFGGPSIQQATTSLLRIERITDTELDEPNSKLTLEAMGKPVAVLRGKGVSDGSTTEVRQAPLEIRHLPAEGTESTLKIVLDLPTAPLESLPWLGAPGVLDAANTALIKQAVMAFHAALSARNWEQTEVLLGAKYDRLAVAGGITVVEVAKQTRDLLEEVFSSAGFALAALAPEDLTLVPVAGLNLVRAEKAGKSPIRGTGTQFDYETPVYLSKVGAVWRIVE